ncbi:MAG: hypothetical protein QOG00_2715 [Pyrinomonadaceae bacterium]|nr:hypothetical protein [Pyrinomonadaceae bacterium]MDX6271945.1 hypothetical protein [Acidobacteriota bacterium]
MPIKEQTYTHKELDLLVVNIELTLVSIVQGVALSFLTESSRDVIVTRRYLFWPYVASGLLVILLFWSRSLMHTFTVIRWPLEFAHNFLYIGSTLLEVIIFTQLQNPVYWFGLSAAYGGVIWLLFAVDLRMIRRRLEERNKEAARALLLVVEREQIKNVRLLMPTTVAFSIAVTLAIHFRPDLFIERQWHFAFALMQLLCAGGYLAYVMRYYRRLLPLMVAAQYEWNGEVMPEEQG